MTPVSWNVTTNSERIVSFRKRGFMPMARRFRATGDSTLAVHLDDAPPEPSASRPSAKAMRRSSLSAESPAAAARDSAAATLDPVA